MPPSTPWFRIHACQFCLTHEIDPLAREPHTQGSTVKYRGSRVYYCASRGCEFFKSIVAGLSPCAQPGQDKWIYHLNVHIPRNNDSNFAHGEWRNTPDGAATHMFGIVAFPGDPASDYVLARPVFYDYKAAASLSQAGSLLGRCDHSHPDCQKMFPSSMPKRLLCLSKDDGDTEIHFHLQSSSHSSHALVPEKYSALTYCWGGDQDVKLNTESLATSLQRAPVTKLPKTLLDGVLVSWDLGLRLIWIDCLCIIQDDPSEMAEEISNLPAIFGNAYVTISASRAAHSQEGFLHPASCPPLDGISFKLPYACPDGRLGSVLLYNRRRTDPIALRAWTFQEFMLSRRVLAYTASQLHWTCRTTEWVQERKETSLFDMYGLYTSLHGGVRDCETWMGMVWHYTNRRLKFPEDMLPAISGIAETWATSSDSYVAGLWLAHLPIGLLWISEQPLLQERGQRYRAPSWSWACLNGSIAWHKHMTTTVDQEFVILSCAAIPTYPNAPYGTISSGSLTVRGHLKRAVSLFDWPSSNPGPELSDEDIDLMYADTDMDYEENILRTMVDKSDVYCLQICIFEETKQQGPSGLMLRRDAEGIYYRIGVFHFRSLETYDIVNEDMDVPDLLSDFQTAQRVASDRFENSVL